MLKDLLLKIGLSESEADVYEAVLLLGQGTPTEISKFSKTTRENTYRILTILKEKHLVEEVESAKQVSYRAENPKVLLEIIKKRKDKLNETKSLMEEAVKRMRSQMYATKNKPLVKYLKGENGVKEAYMKSIQGGGGGTQYEILHSRWSPEIKKWIDKFFIPERVRRGVTKKIILANNSEEKSWMKTNLKEKRKSVEVNTGSFPEGAAVITYKDKLVFISHMDSPEQEADAVVIEQEIIAKAMGALLKSIWDKSIKKD